MSNQGNVIVIIDNDETYLFTSGRWSGPSVPFAVQDCIKDCHDNRSFLINLIKEEAISHPIKVLGNTDTPTVIVDFTIKVVFWRREYDNAMLAEWTFDEYKKLDINNLPLYIDEHL